MENGTKKREHFGNILNVTQSQCLVSNNNTLFCTLHTEVWFLSAGDKNLAHVLDMFTCTYAD